MTRSEFTSDALLERLRKRHAGDAWAFFAQVPDATGFAKARTVDALAMSLWPSRGLELHGFEIKVSRGDWLRELREAEKADGFVSRCDRFWIVAPPKIVAAGELPKTWGLLETRGNTLAVSVDAPKLEPTPLDREFLASLCRQIHKATPAVRALNEARRDARDEGYKAGEQAGRSQAERELRGDVELRRAVAEFEKASGVSIGSSWQAGDVGEAVKIALALNSDGVATTLEYACNTLRNGLRRLEKLRTSALEELPELLKGEESKT